MAEEYTVKFSPAAEMQLANILEYIARSASRAIAENYVQAIVQYANKLELFPHRGMLRDDLFTGLRVIGYRKRVSIAFLVDDVQHQVNVVGIFYGGQDYDGYFRQLNNDLI